MENPSASYSDTELYYRMKGEKHGTERAFSELYNRYSSRVYAYCLRILGDRDTAHDIFQETFVRFYQSAQEERTMTNVAAYLMKIARNLCLNVKRDSKRLLSVEDVHLMHHDVQYENTELLGLVTTALGKLPEEFREAFVLREYDGLSYAEIADVTNTPMSTVKIRLFRARERIRKLLAPYLVDYTD